MGNHHSSNPQATKALSSEDQTMIKGILTYWFPPDKYDRDSFYSPESRKRHWMGGKEVDDYCRMNYDALLESIGNGEKENWLADRDGALAYVIVCDQFSRNMHRDTAKAWDFDVFGLRAAKTIVPHASKFDKYMNFEKLFLLLPYEHSEDKENVAYCIEMVANMLEKAEVDKNEPLVGAMQGMKNFAHGHLKVLEQFGRYPSRNKFLGRTNTTEELIYLDKGMLWT